MWKCPLCQNSQVLSVFLILNFFDELPRFCSFCLLFNYTADLGGLGQKWTVLGVSSKCLTIDGMHAKTAKQSHSTSAASSGLLSSSRKPIFLTISFCISFPQRFPQWVRKLWNTHLKLGCNVVHYHRSIPYVSSYF